MELAILVPVLGRPQNVAPLLESIREATPERYRVYFVCNDDDVEELEAVEAECPDFAQRWRLRGNPNYAAKINYGVAMTDEPLLFLGADDLRFHPGWLEAAKAKLRPGIGVVGTNDLGSLRVMAGEHATHSLVTREYAQQGTIDEPDKLLHEGYQHEWVDDEFVGTAKFRGAWAFAEDSHVEHLHPLWGKADWDPLYRGVRSRMRASHKHFLDRRPQWTSP